MKTFGERRKDTEVRETSWCPFQTFFHPGSESRGEGTAGSSQRRCLRGGSGRPEDRLGRDKVWRELGSSLPQQVEHPPHSR